MTHPVTIKIVNLMVEIVNSSSFLLEEAHISNGGNKMDINTNRKLMIIGAILGMSILSPISAKASCSQADLKGTWYTYSMSADSYGVSAPQTNRCKVVFNSSGSIVASKSSCKLRSYPGLINVNIKGGTIKVNSGCNLSGSVRIFSSFAGSGNIKLEYGTVAKDKRTFSVVGYDTSSPSYITQLNGVKK